MTTRNPLMADGDRWLRPTQVAQLLGISRDTLRRMVKADATFPRYVQISAGVKVLPESELILWHRRKRQEARLAAG